MKNLPRRLSSTNCGSRDCGRNFLKSFYTDTKKITFVIQIISIICNMFSISKLRIEAL